MIDFRIEGDRAVLPKETLEIMIKKWNGYCDAVVNEYDYEGEYRDGSQIVVSKGQYEMDRVYQAGGVYIDEEYIY